MRLLTLAIFLCSITVFADSEYDEGFKHINAASFHSRFSLKGELFITDASGKKLLAPTTDILEWHLGLKSNKLEADWSTKAKGMKDVAVHLEFNIHEDNSISYIIKQYDAMTRSKENPKDVKYGKLLREKSGDIENFAPLSWVAEEGKDSRVILRMTPQLDSLREDGSLEKITIGGDRGSFTISDNQGYLWGDKVRMGGVLSGMTCHRGSFIISYYPFKGAKELGHAFGKTIELNLTDTLTLKIQNDGDLLPGGMKVKVYGKYLPKLKTSSVSSVNSFGLERPEQVAREFGL